MTDVLSSVSASNFARFRVAELLTNENEKCPVQQLLSQCMSSMALYLTEAKPALNPGNVRETNPKLEKSHMELETLKLFGAGIAHDLGNVLTVIVGNLELVRLLQPGRELCQTFEELDEAVKMAKALNTQLNQLFHGTTTVVRESIALGRLLEDATGWDYLALLE